MSQATQELMNEHRAIETVIGLLQRGANRIETGEQIPPDTLARAHGFILNFADHCHHAKEEHILYPAMARRGMPTQSGPIGVMLSEHEMGRRYAGAIKDALPGYAEGDAESTAMLIKSIRNYADLLLEHIQKEDGILYPLSDRVLDDEDKAELMREFERVETEL
ncbi:MAG: hemerythrin domain-containing protein, partial [Chloroflexota bacterium]